MEKVSARSRIDLEPHDKIGGQSIIENTATLSQRKLERDARFDVAIRLDLETPCVGNQVITSNTGRPQIEQVTTFDRQWESRSVLHIVVPIEFTERIEFISDAAIQVVRPIEHLVFCLCVHWQDEPRRRHIVSATS